MDGAYCRRKRLRSLQTNRHAALRKPVAIREFLAGSTKDEQQ